MLEKMQSDQINELAMALSKVQGEMSSAIKDSSNPFFKSKYADLSSIWNCCKEPLSKNGLAIIQTMDLKEGQNVLITTLAHASGQWMRSCLPILNEKNNAQGLGSAITYMRRYALSAIVGVTCDEDDDGNEACKGSDKRKELTTDKISADEASRIEKMLGECDDIYVSNVEKYYEKEFGITEWKQLPKAEFQKLWGNINNKLKGKAV